MRKVPDISEYERTISSLNGVIVVLENEQKQLKRELTKYEANITFVNVMGGTIVVAGLISLGYVMFCLIELWVILR